MNNQMKMNSTKYFTRQGFIFVLLLTAISGCKKFLDIPLTPTQISRDDVFASDATATSALTGIYNEMLAITSYASGSNYSISSLTSLSSDESYYFTNSDLDRSQFYSNSLLSDNQLVLSLWTSLYRSIYQANAIIEGVQKSTYLTDGTKKQLTGESLFIRAFAHFYLVNLFGEVPVSLTTDYQVNSTLPRVSIDSVYSAIEKDLIAAESLVSEDYITSERVRPNKSAVQSLLARVYLYQNKWAKAEENASLVLSNTTQYSILSSLNEVFLANSVEAIWQLRPVDPSKNTWDANYSVVITPNPQYNVLTPNFIESFTSGDNRLADWISTFESETDTFYFPFKYKIFQEGFPLTEYSMVLRLAEQYLIRAESRANQENLEGAIEDLDVLRTRAGLLPVNDIILNVTRTNLLELIEQERRSELFTEWGHRWFDLKRLGTANTILSGIKGNTWNSNDIFYPVPQSEINRNPNLIP